MERFSLAFILVFGALCGTCGYWAGMLLTKFEMLCAAVGCAL